MKFANFRKSLLSLTKVVDNLKANAKEHKIEVVSENTIGKTTMFGIQNKAWHESVLKHDKNLIGFIPNQIYITEVQDGSEVGFSSALVMSSVTHNPEIAKLAEDINSSILALVMKSAELTELKVANVKLFSTMSCPYCKMEAKWLEEKGIKFVDIHVDLNQQEAERMVQRTGQMGVPVTEVEYDNGEYEYIIGFDKSRLSQVLSIK